MPSVLLGNVAYGTNDPKLVRWIWIGRNCKYLMGMPLDFHGWGDFSNRAVSRVGTLETRPVELLQECVAHVGMRCASQGRSHSHLGWISSHCCADSCVSCCLDCQTGAAAAGLWRAAPPLYPSVHWGSLWPVWSGLSLLVQWHLRKPPPHGCWCRLSKLSVMFFFFDVKV